MRIIGHRGARGHAPENTRAAIRKGISLGAEWIEIDVQTVEDTPIVIHDLRLERTTNGSGYVADHSLTELRALDAGNGEKLPFLSEVLDEIENRASLLVELKDDRSAGPVIAMLAERIGAGRLSYDTVVVQSFNLPELLKVKILNPKIVTAALIMGIPAGLASEPAALGCTWFNPSIEFISEELIKDAHGRGLSVNVYTVNLAGDISRMIEMGVDGIITDFPERIINPTAGR